MVRPIINSEKRIVQITLTNVDESNQTNIVLVDVKQDPDNTAPNDVAVGTVIKAVYVELWVLATSQQPNTSTVILVKSPANTGTPTVGEFSNLNAWANKKNILQMHQGLIGDANTNPVPFFREWIPIPKGKQRFGLGDKLHLAIHAITDSVQVCGLVIFKAYN